MVWGEGFGNQPWYPKLISKQQNTGTEDYELNLKWVKIIIFNCKEYKALLKRIELLEKQVEEFQDGGLEGTERHRIKEDAIRAMIKMGIDKTVATKVFCRVILDVGYRSGMDVILEKCIKVATAK